MEAEHWFPNTHEKEVATLSNQLSKWFATNSQHSHS